MRLVKISLLPDGELHCHHRLERFRRVPILLRERWILQVGADAQAHQASVPARNLSPCLLRAAAHCVTTARLVRWLAFLIRDPSTPCPPSIRSDSWLCQTGANGHTVTQTSDSTSCNETSRSSSGRPAGLWLAAAALLRRHVPASTAVAGSRKGMRDAMRIHVCHPALTCEDGVAHSPRSLRPGLTARTYCSRRGQARLARRRGDEKP
jgi:hypothetical protein